MTRQKSRLLPGIAIAVVSLGLLGAVTYAFFWDPTPSYEAAPNEAATQITSDDLARAAEVRVFFGHMSVGRNVLSGVRDLYESKGVPMPDLIEIAPGQELDLPDQGGAIVHSLIGENYHPLGKLKNFDTSLRAGMGDEVDVALLKFCYLDVNWYTDVDSLFESYSTTMKALEADYPDVRFVHVTVPLTTGPYGIKDHLKVALGRDNNPAREKYNDKIRASYPPEQVLDLAAVESKAPDGATMPELYTGYTSDGSHLNETGSALVAVELLRHLTGSGI